MPTARYTLADGTRVPGVTTIINRFKDAGGLLQWAFKQGQSGAATLYEKRDEAADIGTLAHKMIEDHVNGVDVSEPDDERGAQAWNAFSQYLEWEGQTGIRLLSKFQEISLVSEKYRFGGTPDALGQIGNKLVLVDWKSSNGIYRDYAIQLAAYKHLIEEGVRLDTREPLDMGEIQGFHLLRIAKEYPDFEHRYFGELGVAWEQFRDFRACYDRDAELKKRIR